MKISNFKATVKLHTHRNDQVNIKVSPKKYVQKGPNQDRF